MKFENIYINCKNLNERKFVISVVESMGYRFRKNGCLDNELIVCLYEDGEYQVSNHVRWVTLTYQQFMEKYGMSDLQKKIEEAKNKTHMSLHQLSKAIGFNEHYLSAVVNRNRSIETQDKVIALLDDLIQKLQQELTHDFEGKALNTQVEDAMMISKSEYESLQKQVSHKTQVAEKHADMRAKAEAEAQESNNKMLIAEQDSEKWQCDYYEEKRKYELTLSKYEKKSEDYWTVSRENIDLTNSKRAISIWLAVSILIIVLMTAFGVLHFNGVV